MKPGNKATVPAYLVTAGEAALLSLVGPGRRMGQMKSGVHYYPIVIVPSTEAVARQAA